MQKDHKHSSNNYINLRDAPIQRKLMMVILITSAVVVLLICSAYIIFEYYAFKRSLESQVATLAAITASNSSGALAFDAPQDAYEVLKSLSAEKRIKAASLYNRDGNLFARYPVLAGDSTFPSKPAADGFIFTSNTLEGFVPVLEKKDRIGTLFIRSDMNAMYKQLQRYIELAAWLFCFSLVVAYFLSRLLRKTISQPILALENTARIISEKKDYAVRAVKAGKDEMGRLTDAFNDMLTTIESQNLAITSFNQNLENKVRERTNELEAANFYLKQQNEFVETIFNSSANLIAVLDTEFRYKTVNRKVEECYNVKKEDLLGKTYMECFPQAVGSQTHNDILRAMSGEQVHTSITRSTVINGYFENFFIPLRTDGKIYGVLLMSNIITDIVLANEKLQQLNIQLEKSNRDLEQFAFIASHDLQEPLRKIHIFNDMMGENFNDIESVKKYHSKIEQSAKRMQELIQDVLNFSRISLLEEQFVQNDLNKIMEELKNDFEVTIREKNASILYNNLPSVPGITLQLSQLFSNLLSNSLKYNERNPVVEIKARNLSKEEIMENVKLNPALSYVEIKFTDNGIGFDAKYNEQIFTIFQRLHGKQSYSGTGIGLALCRKIVENHKGIISAEAEVGVGATFTIILPLQQEQ